MSIDPSIPPPTPPPSIPAVPPPSVPPPNVNPTPAPAGEMDSGPAAATATEAPAKPAAESAAAPAAGDNTVAFVAYLTLVGFIVAIILNKDEKKNSLGNFHLRQMLGLIIIGTVIWMGNLISGNIPILKYVLVPAFMILGLGLMVLWILGFIDALNRRQKPVPFVGDIIQKQLKGAFDS